MELKGPIKGPYLLKRTPTLSTEREGIGSVGFLVENPCKPDIDSDGKHIEGNEIKIVLDTSTPVELKYEEVQHSAYWLPRCKGRHEMKLAG